jgi:hypothetical protein
MKTCECVKIEGPTPWEIEGPTPREIEGPHLGKFKARLLELYAFIQL